MVHTIVTIQYDIIWRNSEKNWSFILDDVNGYMYTIYEYMYTIYDKQGERA